LAILLGLGFYLFPPEITGTLFKCFILKVTVEFLLLIRGCFVFNRTDLIRYFPLWAILQVPYVVIVGFLGTFGTFKWKGRSTRPITKQNSTYNSAPLDPHKSEKDK
jgi:hypothetical protein